MPGQTADTLNRLLKIKHFDVKRLIPICNAAARRANEYTGLRTVKNGRWELLRGVILLKTIADTADGYVNFFRAVTQHWYDFFAQNGFCAACGRIDIFAPLHEL
ncbi:hypothetical protein [Paraburkholderia guartelaensis]|uniref:hypothetical protein n=1 Tax=Paraburkholderia guartelaensis TaxID=2546446 RepID=UPI002AB71F87|nr:hypothetical protein [Paraburkholderia guartelaensis]